MPILVTGLILRERIEETHFKLSLKGKRRKNSLSDINIYNNDKFCEWQEKQGQCKKITPHLIWGTRHISESFLQELVSAYDGLNKIFIPGDIWPDFEY